MKHVTIGILGFGTVAQGVLEVLDRNAGEIRRRCGYDITVKSVSRRSWQGVAVASLPFACRPAAEIVADPEIEIVLELMGGLEPARALVAVALENGKHVITANKALIAERGEPLFDLARERGLELSYEAAVAGGIPVIKVLREAMSGNEITLVAGIINGTANFILSAMTSRGATFAAALAEAQKLGYAEADPSFDVNGTDAAHKTTILASIAFGIPLQFNKVYIEGIDSLTTEDIDNVAGLGYTIKHLGLAIRRDDGIELRVHPTLIPKDSPLAGVCGAMNAIQINGNAIGDSLYYGPGAGKRPTASAVVADLIDCIRELNLARSDRLAAFGFHQVLEQDALPVLGSDDYHASCYLRLLVDDRIGVLAEITRILATQGISIDSIVQKTEQRQNGQVPLIVLTDRVREKAMNDAIAILETLDAVVAPVVRIRMESLT